MERAVSEPLHSFKMSIIPYNAIKMDVNYKNISPHPYEFFY